MDNTFLYIMITLLVILFFFLFLYNQYNDLSNKIKGDTPAVVINKTVKEKTVIIDEEEKERRKREEIEITGGTAGAGFGLTGKFSSILNPTNVKAPTITTSASFPAVIKSPGSIPGSLPGSLAGSIPGSLPGSLAGSIPGSLAGSLPGSASNLLILPSDTTGTGDIRGEPSDPTNSTSLNDRLSGVNPLEGTEVLVLAFQDYAPASLDLPPTISFKEDPEPPTLAGLLNDDLGELRKDLNYFFKTSDVSRQKKHGPPLIKPKPEELPRIKHLYGDGSYDDIDNVHVYKTQ